MIFRRIGSAFVLAGTFGIFALSVPAALAKCRDRPAAETVRANIASTCVCTAATNHGQYVKCVTHEVKTAVANGLPTNCKGAVVRCAARSTCGKPGFVTCCRALPGSCDNDGVCQDGTTVCSADADCPARTKCSTKKDSDHCVAAGGSPGTGSCCDAVCAASPSGAFLND